MNEASRLAIEATMRELAELDAADDAVAEGLARRTRGDAAPSAVYSFRLDTDEVAALERRAAVLGVKPTVLARNLVRIGLQAKLDEPLSQAVSRLELAVAEVRRLVA